MGYFRNEDAERDCSVVLGLDHSNVKGLYRRAQARIGLGKHIEAESGESDRTLFILYILSHADFRQIWWKR